MKKKKIDDYIIIKDKNILAKTYINIIEDGYITSYDKHDKILLSSDINILDKTDNSITVKTCDTIHSVISSTKNIEDGNIHTINTFDKENQINIFIENNNKYNIKYKQSRTVVLKVANDSSKLIMNEYFKKIPINIEKIIGIEYFKEYIKNHNSYYLIETEGEFIDYNNSKLSINRWSWLKVSNKLKDYDLIPAFNCFIDDISNDISKYKLMISLIETIQDKSILYLAFRDHFKINI